MISAIATKVIEAMLAILLMSVVIFCIIRFTGDPVALMLGDGASLEEKLALTRELGLDRSLPEQYLAFAANAITGDFGRSLTASNQPALEAVLSRMPASLSLAAVALVGTLVVGVLMGVAAARSYRRWPDMAIRMVALLGQSVPSFWLGIVLMYVFSVKLGLLPTSGYGSWQHYVLPAATLGAFTLAAITRLVRGAMLEALGSEYIKLARVKGLPEALVVWKHALGNSLIPVITFMGTFFGVMITGAVVVETVFAWPGIGRLAYESIVARDFPVVQAVVLLTTTLFILVNLAVDLLYILVDPRMRHAK